MRHERWPSWGSPCTTHPEEVRAQLIPRKSLHNSSWGRPSTTDRGEVLAQPILRKSLHNSSRGSPCTTHPEEFLAQLIQRKSLHNSSWGSPCTTHPEEVLAQLILRKSLRNSNLWAVGICHSKERFYKVYWKLRKVVKSDVDALEWIQSSASSCLWKIIKHGRNYKEIYEYIYIVNALLSFHSD